jgi:hypothetical protein
VKTACQVNAKALEILQLFDKLFKIDNTARAYIKDHLRIKDSGRDEVQGNPLALLLNRMACIRAAIESGNNLIAWSNHVYDSRLAFIAILEAHQNI